jgi:parallel beta-helix repeat protein
MLMKNFYALTEHLGVHVVHALRTVVLCVAALSTLILWTRTASASDYYVSPSGDDTHNGDIAHPFRSLQKAADTVQPGDVVYLREGIHNYHPSGSTFALCRITRGGTTGKPVTFTRYRDPKTGKPENAVVQTFARKTVGIGGNDTVEASTFSALFGAGFFIQASWVNLKDLVVVGNRSTISLAEAQRYERTLRPDMPVDVNRRMLEMGIGVYPDPAKGLYPEHILIEDCELREHSSSAIILTGVNADRSADYVTIRGNRVHANNQRNNQGSSAINLLHLRKNDGSTATKIIIEENVVYDNENMLIWARPKKNPDGTDQKDASGNLILSDYNGGWSDGNGIIVDICHEYTGRILVRNNVVFDNGASGICVTKSRNVEIVNNTVYRNSRSPHLQWANVSIVGKESTNILVKDNIFWFREDQWLFHGKKHGEDGIAFTGNIYYKDGAMKWDSKWGSLPSGNQYTIPSFIDASVHDFRLKPGSSDGKGAVLPIKLSDSSSRFGQDPKGNNMAFKEIIDGKVFSEGLKLEGQENILIRGCQITNPNGTYGIWLKNCRNVRVENCVVRRIGTEAMQERDVRIIKGYEYVPVALDRVYGVHLENSHNITVSGNDITDSASKGITVEADRWDTTSDVLIEKNRIAYIYDDGIDFHTRSTPGATDPQANLLMRGIIIRENLIHDIGLGLTRLGFARHGIYLSVRDAIVEGNTIYNCYYGEGISIRNSAIVRRNKVRNCARACIAYWAQTSTEGTSGEVRIEDNECRQDFALPIPMRHISNPDKKVHHLPLGTIIINHASNPYAKIRKFIIRENRLFVGEDYAEKNPVIGGNGEPARNQATFEITGNHITDLRATAFPYANLPSNVDTSQNAVGTISTSTPKTEGRSRKVQTKQCFGDNDEWKNKQ